MHNNRIKLENFKHLGLRVSNKSSNEKTTLAVATYHHMLASKYHPVAE